MLYERENFVYMDINLFLYTYCQVHSNVVPHLSDCYRFKKGLAAGEHKSSNCFVVIFFGVWLWGGRKQSCFTESFELLYEFSNLVFNWDDDEVTN